MRKATEAERRNWLAKAAYVAPAVEIITATRGGDADLSRRLEGALPDAPDRFADLWVFFHVFLRAQDWVAVWDDFCWWLANERAGVAVGGLVYAELEDELEALVERCSTMDDGEGE